MEKTIPHASFYQTQTHFHLPLSICTFSDPHRLHSISSVTPNLPLIAPIGPSTTPQRHKGGRARFDRFFAQLNLPPLNEEAEESTVPRALPTPMICPPSTTMHASDTNLIPRPSGGRVSIQDLLSTPNESDPEPILPSVQQLIQSQPAPEPFKTAPAVYQQAQFKTKQNVESILQSISGRLDTATAVNQRALGKEKEIPSGAHNLKAFVAETWTQSLPAYGQSSSTSDSLKRSTPEGFSSAPAKQMKSTQDPLDNRSVLDLHQFRADVREMMVLCEQMEQDCSRSQVQPFPASHLVWRARLLHSLASKCLNSQRQLVVGNESQPLSSVFFRSHRPEPSPIVRRRSRQAETSKRSCHSCNATETPEWRRGPDGARTLCNACGLHYAKLIKKQKKDTVEPVPTVSDPLAQLHRAAMLM